MTTLESTFQKEVLRPELDRRFPGCLIIKGNSAVRQGVPDWIVLWGPRWGFLEAKRSRSATLQTNQEYYVELLDEMSFAAFIDPSNYMEVLDQMERAFKG